MVPVEWKGRTVWGGGTADIRPYGRLRPEGKRDLEIRVGTIDDPFLVGVYIGEGGQNQ